MPWLLQVLDVEEGRDVDSRKHALLYRLSCESPRRLRNKGASTLTATLASLYTERVPSFDIVINTAGGHGHTIGYRINKIRPANQ